MVSKKLGKTGLAVELNIPTSDKNKDPCVIDAEKAIKLTFSEDLDKNTVPNGVKVFKVKSDGEELETNIRISSDENSPRILYLSSESFSEGEEYKLSINTNLISTSGDSLEEEFASYFATDYSFNLDEEGIPDLGNVRSLIIVISDLHLGANDSYAELTQNREALIDFLEKVRFSPHVKELVIAGDLVDEWFIPMHVDTFNGKTQRDFVKAVADNNQAVFDAFNNIINDGNVKVTYVPGNHDLLIDSEDIETIMPGISQARDVMGLGAYIPSDFPELVIEHGHRYNFFCAPDFSNRQLTNTDSILPPGYFFTRMATTSVIEGRPANHTPLPELRKNELGPAQIGYFIYWNVWKELISEFPVNEGLEEKVLNTGLDGLEGFYAITDFLPYQDPESSYIDVYLHKGIIEGWDERQEINLVPVKIPLEEALMKAASASHLDDQSQIQFFENPSSDKRIVVFGHTHEARIRTNSSEDGKHVYVNSGTWIDKNPCTMTFVVVTPPKNKDSAPAFVHLYQYNADGDIKRLESQAITDLK